MEKVKIASVTHYEKDKQGNPLISKTGKPYSRCMIKTQDNRTLSGFGSQETKNFKQSDEVELEITQNGQYLNFKLPSKDITRQEFNNLKYQVAKLEMRIDELQEKLNPIGKEVDQVFADEPPETDEQ